MSFAFYCSIAAQTVWAQNVSKVSPKKAAFFDACASWREARSARKIPASCLSGSCDCFKHTVFRILSKCSKGLFNPLNPKPQWKWNFSLHDHYLFEYSSDKNKGSDHWGWDVLMFRQILLTIVIRNVWRSVMRICIFISWLKGLKKTQVLNYLPCIT